jgi:hypothetical protein
MTPLWPPFVWLVIAGSLAAAFVGVVVLVAHVRLWAWRRGKGVR